MMNAECTFFKILPILSKTLTSKDIEHFQSILSLMLQKVIQPSCRRAFRDRLRFDIV